MYRYTEFDKAFVRSRAAQFRDQLERWQNGTLSEDAFRPLRLQNGWYVQRHAPMLRVAVPYGELSSAQIRMLGRIAREYDEPDAHIYRAALDAQRKLGTLRLPTHHAHFTTRTNVQYNWIPLSKAADVMDLLASVDMHGIQTSGNCIRNISCDERAGVAPDEIADPRPFAEIMRKWTTLHPEFAFLPRKFKIAITGAVEDRAATDWHDVGLRLVHNGEGELGFRVSVGGGMGRTPMTGAVLREFLPWHQIMNYIEAVVRVYNRYGRRDNKYKARIKILVKAEGQRYIDDVEAEFREIVELDGGPHTIPQAELERVSASFVPPRLAARSARDMQAALHELDVQAAQQPMFARWLQRNVALHKDPSMRIVTLSFKRLLQAPGDASADQLDLVAGLVDRFFRRRSARHAYAERRAAVGACRRSVRLVGSGAQRGARERERPVADRHDRVPRRRLLRTRQRPLAADRRSHRRTLSGPGRTRRYRRDRPAYQRLHQLVRPSSQRPYRHSGRG